MSFRFDAGMDFPVRLGAIPFRFFNSGNKFFIYFIELKLDCNWLPVRCTEKWFFRPSKKII